MLVEGTINRTFKIVHELIVSQSIVVCAWPLVRDFSVVFLLNETSPGLSKLLKKLSERGPGFSKPD